MKKLASLIMIICFQGFTVHGQSIGELKKKAEIQKLKADNYPKSEFFFGANLNSNFGTLESTTNTINLESVSMEFDNFIPSFRLGYKYLLNPEKHHGLFIHFNRYSKKALKLSDSNDFNPAFDTSFNEIRAGVVYGKLQLGIGKILDDQVLSSSSQEETASYSLNTVGLSYILFRSNDLSDPRNLSDYWSVEAGLNYVSDFEDLNYTSFSIGFNYHFTFQRSLDLDDKIWLQKRTFD
jgi:hypothetical protein